MFDLGFALALSAFLLLANAFFVAAEFAIVKVRPTRIASLVNHGSQRARLLQGITRRLDAYLSACQFGITLASLALGWIGEPALAHLIEPHLRLPAEIAGVTSHALAFALSLFFITFLHTTLGEQVPKVFALQRAESVALWMSVPLRAFYLLASPLVWFLNGSARGMLRLLGLASSADGEHIQSPDELRLVLRNVKLDPGALRLIDRLFDYTQRVARHVMTLRRDVVVLEAGRPFRENLDLALSNQFTRYPLVEPGTDKVLGYVHLKDLVAALASGSPPERVRDLARQPIYCGEDTRLEALRREFQRRRVHIAVVQGADERFVGIVTLEDLLEEFVGEIQDEQDIGEVPPIVRIPDGGFEADGRLTLDVAARDLDLTLVPPSADIETLGGYLLARIGRPPRPGDTVEVSGYRLTAFEIRDGRIRRVRGERVPDAPPDDDLR